MPDMNEDFDPDLVRDMPENDNPFENRRSHYEVGYGKPPKQNRFQKGNKAAAGRGRRKKITRLEQALRKIAGEEVVAIINGKRVRMTRREALARQMFERASKSPRDTLRLMHLLLSIEDEPFANVEDHKITIEFVSDRPTGLPGGPGQNV